MAKSFVERELKFDVRPRFVVPDLEPLLPLGGRVQMATERLRSDYYDTADRALLRADVTLRRRSGTADVGWQLKIPHDPFREELQVEGTGDAVPPELARLVLGVAHGLPLGPVATLLTERSIHRLLDGQGRVLAEVDDDTVHAAAAGASATISSWREVEVELGHDPAVDVQLTSLRAIARELTRAGAEPARSSSKLARALPGPSPRAGRHRRGRAGDIVMVYLAAQQKALLRGDLALRRGDVSAVHPTRVAGRRFRNCLRVFGELFEAERAAALDAELRWYAGLLGSVRDQQVLQVRLERLVAGVDDALMAAAVREHITTESARQMDQHRAELDQELGGRRYLMMLAEIDDWVSDPPRGPAFDRAPKRVARELRRAEAEVGRRLDDAIADEDDLVLLHRARKASKRARYGAEAAEPVLGAKRSRRLSRRYEKLQDVLGEHQDSALGAEFLARLGGGGDEGGATEGFTLGLLYERELVNARDARKRARRLARTLR